jgi:hypothetical protein
VGSTLGYFLRLFILDVDKVVCFDRDLDVFILKVVRGVSGNEKSAGQPTPFGHSFLRDRVVQIEVRLFRVLSAERLTIEGVAIRLCSQSDPPFTNYVVGLDTKAQKMGHPG